MKLALKSQGVQPEDDADDATMEQLALTAAAAAEGGGGVATQPAPVLPADVVAQPSDGTVAAAGAEAKGSAAAAEATAAGAAAAGAVAEKPEGEPSAVGADETAAGAPAAGSVDAGAKPVEEPAAVSAAGAAAAGAAATAAAGAAANGGAAAAGASDGDNRPGWAKELNLFIGDRVLTSAKRYTELWDNKEGTVLGLLSSKCKVQIETEGATRGQIHQFDPARITKIEAKTTSGAAPAQKRPASADDIPATAAAGEPPQKNLKQAVLDSLFQGNEEDLFDESESESPLKG